MTYLTEKAIVDSRLHPRCITHDVYFLVVMVEIIFIGIDVVVSDVTLYRYLGIHMTCRIGYCANYT